MSAEKLLLISFNPHPVSRIITSSCRPERSEGHLQSQFPSITSPETRKRAPQCGAFHTHRTPRHFFNAGLTEAQSELQFLRLPSEGVLRGNWQFPLSGVTGAEP